MNYETIILEMLSRIQALEQQVADLQKKLEGGGQAPEKPEKISTADIQAYIEQRKCDAAAQGEQSLTLRANEVHRALRLQSRFPMVCNAMRKCMRPGDEVVHETPSGYSSSLEIRYYLNDI